MNVGYTNDDTIPFWLGCTTIVLAGSLATLLTILSNDNISRKYLLSSKQLMNKRYHEYQYQWSNYLLRIEMKLNYYINHNRNITSTINTTSLDKYDDNIEKNEYIELLINEIEITEFVNCLIVHKEYNTIRIGRIGKDRSTNKYNRDIREHFIWLYVTTTPASATSLNINNNIIIYQIPIIMFGRILKNVIEMNVMFTGAFCFIADASANIASNFICDLIEHVSNVETSTTTNKKYQNIVILSQPYWMICYTILIEQNIYSLDNMQIVLFALMRLEAFRFGIESMSTSTPVPSTILVTIPSSCVPILLPALQETFPADRHIFAYTGCIETIQYALSQKKATSSYRNNTKIPTNLEEALSLNYRNNTTDNNNDPILYCIPLRHEYLHKSINVNQYKYSMALANVPIHIVSIIETWMCAVDGFFQLKHVEMNARQRKNSKNKKIRQLYENNIISNQEQYTPYIFKLDLLLLSMNNDKIEYGTNRYWLLRSLIQYVLGSKTREILEDVMKIAIEWLEQYCLKDYHHNSNGSSGKSSKTNTTNSIMKFIGNRSSNKNTHIIIDKQLEKVIENVIFQHKLILIPNKTLQDTVLPNKNWVLLNTVKSGCACCPPDEEDDDDDNDEQYTYQPTSAMVALKKVLNETNNNSIPISMLIGSDNNNNNIISTTVTNSNNNNSLTSTEEEQERSNGTIPTITTLFVNDNRSSMMEHAAAADDDDGKSNNNIIPTTAATPFSYVDGRSGFAFDPNRFS